MKSKDDHETKFNNNLGLVIVAIVGILAIFAVLMITHKPNGGETPQVASFEECTAAGYPITESYPRQCRTPNGELFTEEIKEVSGKAKEMGEDLCKSSGGNWNECSNRCQLDNAGRPDAICTMLCEALCECGGLAGFRCPMGYACKTPDGVADGLGYCVPEGQIQKPIGGDKDEHGCLIGAGYSWNEEVGACARAWELDENKTKATKVAIGPLSFPVTLIEVTAQECEGCFLVQLQRIDNNLPLDIQIENWTISAKSSEKTMPRLEWLSELDAREIANASDCAKQGNLTANIVHNENTRTWWTDLAPFENKSGCNPACVVSEDNRTAEVNWRCTGLLVPNKF
jgi:hypothetical protein